MSKRKGSVPHRLNDLDRSRLKWNLLLDGSDSLEPVTVSTDSQSKKKRKASKVLNKQPPVPDTAHSSPIPIDAFDIDERFNTILTECTFYLRVNSGATKTENCILLGSLSLHVDAKAVCDGSDFWIYVNTIPDRSVVYYDNGKTRQYYYMVRGILDTQLLSDLCYKCYLLESGSFDSSTGCLTVKVYFLKSYCDRYDQRSHVHNVMSHFFGITKPSYDDMHCIENHSTDILYDAVKAYHSENDIPAVDISHPSLVPKLRPYQSRAVQWMLQREDEQDIPDELHCLFTEVKLPDNNTVYYDKFNGIIALEKPVAIPLPTGGILADEMGLGKTVEVLACVLLNPFKGEIPDLIVEHKNIEPEKISCSVEDKPVVNHSENNITNTKSILIKDCADTGINNLHTADNMCLKTEIIGCENDSIKCEKDDGTVTGNEESVINGVDSVSTFDNIPVKVTQNKRRGHRRLSGGSDNWESPNMSSDFEDWEPSKNFNPDNISVNETNLKKRGRRKMSSGSDDWEPPKNMSKNFNAKIVPVKETKYKKRGRRKLSSSSDEWEVPKNISKNFNADSENNFEAADLPTTRSGRQVKGLYYDLDENSKTIKRPRKKRLPKGSVEKTIEEVIAKYCSKSDNDKGKKQLSKKTILSRKHSKEIRAELVKWYNNTLTSMSMVKRERVVPRRLTVDCICGEEGERKEKIQCTVCKKWQHKICVKYTMGTYYCPICWQDQELIVSSATLIVSPFSICHQWVSEIYRHVCDSEFRVLVYEGVKKDSFMQPTSFAKHNIVITTYETLRRELNFAEVNTDSTPTLRHGKRYMACPSPLPCVHWWRLCMDEAQMVESTSCKVSEMAKKLTCVHRWAITGTPVQKSLQDLFGLLQYLGVDPYHDVRNWQNLLYDPYCYGNYEPLHNLMFRLLWRTQKKDVLQETSNKVCNDGTYPTDNVNAAVVCHTYEPDLCTETVSDTTKHNGSRLHTTTAKSKVHKKPKRNMVKPNPASCTSSNSETIITCEKNPLTTKTIPAFHYDFFDETPFYLNEVRTSCVSVAHNAHDNFNHCLIFTSRGKTIVLQHDVGDFLTHIDEISKCIKDKKPKSICLVNGDVTVILKCIFGNMCIVFNCGSVTTTLSSDEWVRFLYHLPTIKCSICSYYYRTADIRKFVVSNDCRNDPTGI